MFDPIKWAAFKVLIRQLGLWRALRVGLRLEYLVWRGHPFKELEAAEDPNEVASRLQLGPAVVLFGLLKARYGHELAFMTTGAVIEAGAHAFLHQSVGELKRQELAMLDENQRRSYLQDRLDKFPNALFRIDRVDEEEVSFTVTDCRFVRLCRQLNVPEMAPLFCAGDASYFGGVQPGVQLIRPQTLAGGGDCCPFTLQWEKPQD